MIKNERQYRMTKAQADKFTQALRELRGAGKRTAHPVLHKAQLDALRSQLADLACEITEYERLRSGKQKVLALTSLADLPKTLIQGRIAAGLSQEELAHKLGLKPQQVQRYEATDYQSASLERVNAVARALGIKLRHRAEFRLAS
ncbi:MAG: helix-turn-helix transcriptional regulator [Deltaproteobacteria bacterium]|nr:helix-turn-helix transcriptional regulator [Deltaproteobacteria bacterium]